MKIELNTRTREIKEIPTKKEAERYEENKDKMDAEIVSIICASLAAKIHQIFGDDAIKEDKSVNMCYGLVKNYIKSMRDNNSDS